MRDRIDRRGPLPVLIEGAIPMRPEGAAQRGAVASRRPLGWILVGVEVLYQAQDGLSNGAKLVALAPVTWTAMHMRDR